MLESAMRSVVSTTPSLLRSALVVTEGVKETMRDVAVLANISGRVVITSSSEGRVNFMVENISTGAPRRLIGTGL